MKKILVLSVLGLSLIASTAVIAQQKGERGARTTRAEAKDKFAIRATATADRMEKELALTTEQKAEVYKIALASYQENMPSKESLDKFNGEINKVLTQDQIKVKHELDRKKMAEAQKNQVIERKAVPMRATNGEKI